MIDSRSNIEGILILKKKPKLLPLLLVLITGCKYGSNFEANEACKKWKEKGDKKNVEIEAGWNYDYDKNGEMINIEQNYISKEVNSRSCKIEESTKQYLGFELKSGEKKLKKYFKY